MTRLRVNTKPKQSNRTNFHFSKLEKGGNHFKAFKFNLIYIITQQNIDANSYNSYTKSEILYAKKLMYVYESN